MAEKEVAPQQPSFYQTDLINRIRDLEEKNKILKERLLLIGKNLINIKNESESEITSLKNKTKKLEDGLKRFSSLLEGIISESNNFVRRSQINIIERMLKDFQPLEFLRKKDVEELIEQKLKTKKSNK